MLYKCRVSIECTPPVKVVGVGWKKIQKLREGGRGGWVKYEINIDIVILI